MGIQVDPHLRHEQGLPALVRQLTLLWRALATYLNNLRAASIPIDDAGGYFTTDTVEAALQQLGAGGGGGSGTVTSVALSLPAIFSVSGSPVTTSGTLTGALQTQAANLLWAGPTTGAAAAPTFRALVTADIPDGTVTAPKLASITSAQLAGVISDETGTGALVFAGSPTLTGTPAAPTAALGTNTTQLATTAFVKAAVDAGPLGAGAWVVIRKNSSETRTSTATMTDDSQLTVSLQSGKLYVIRGTLFVAVTTTSGGFKYQGNFTGTNSNLQSVRHNLTIQTAGSTNNENDFSTGAMPSGAGSFVGTGTSGIACVRFEVVLRTTSAGTFSIQWSQNTSAIVGTTVEEGSYLEYADFT